MSKKFKGIKTGVIGVGNMGKYHVEKYFNNSSLVGIFDTNLDLSNSLARKYGCLSYDNLDSLLLDVDAVSICVPTYLHDSIFAKVVHNGVHSLVEKPLSSDIISGQKMLELSKENNIVTAVGHIERFNPVNDAILRELKKDSNSSILSLIFRRFSPRPVQINDVSVIMDTAIHDLDLSNSFLGKNNVKVDAFGILDKKSNTINQADILLRYDNGISSICQSSWYSPAKVRDVEIMTSSKIIKASYLDSSIRILEFDNKEYSYIVEKED
ncbi:MAG: Gfo/Idh/MocA family oxidoreductase, partial [Candidatus Thermoplasmatota archaeon]|nr:Gfo/Idh/MocA family oxidoreductase [Candidatus Thermoplasmatota archaeon]